MKVKQLDPNVNLPTKATDGSAGYDLQAAISEPLTLKAGESKLIPTGLAIFIEDPSKVAFILPRSKLGAKQGLVVGNLTGVIDSDYQGQWFVSAWNRNPLAHITIEPYQAIAQFVVLQLAKDDFEVVEDFETVTQRADGGISKDVDTRNNTNDLS
jgi:dUTP pyrophosphatase